MTKDKYFSFKLPYKIKKYKIPINYHDYYCETLKQKIQRRSIKILSIYKKKIKKIQKKYKNCYKNVKKKIIYNFMMNSPNINARCLI